MIVLAHPEALCLAAPAALAWWLWLRRDASRWWRMAMLATIVLAAAGPEIAYGRGGSDVVLVLDRSTSMPAAQQRYQDELVRLAGDQRRSGDRLAVVMFGAQAQIAQGPQGTDLPRLSERTVPGDGSDLASALSLAAGLVPPGRTARVLVHSDGEATGAEPRLAGAVIAARGIAIDALPVRREPLPDAAVLDVELPGKLRLGESFVGAIRFISDANERRAWRITREGRVVASGSVDLHPLQPATVTFADRPPHPGLARYQVDLELRPPPGVENVVAAAVRLLDAASPGTDEEKHARSDALRAALASPEAASLLSRLDDPGQAEAIAKRLFGSDAFAPLVHRLAKDLVDRPDNDRMPLNNTAVAALVVEGGERVLVMGGDGTPGNLARALRAAGLVVECRREGPVGLDDLLACRALVLCGVPADRLGIESMEAIANWVEHLGGGLVMTGGRRGFGAGGYHKSPVERVLPVTMELRDEHRKLAVAMAITMDRSGSMSVPIAGGRTKMDLADEGACAAIEMLSPLDRVAVHAVDSAPHVVIPMTPVSDPARLVARIRGIRSEGGGIYVYQALLAAGKELLDTQMGTRHLVLFADANDAEEPGDYRHLVADYVAAGITVSVIAMGTDHDVDAEMLKDIANRGGGRCSFADHVEDLPRLFSQETVLVARTSWVANPVRLKPLAALNAALGAQPTLSGDWPDVAGYNLTYARDRATVLAMAPGDPEAPALSSWRIGTGRAAAVTLDVEGPDASGLLAWDGYSPLLASVTRWVAGGDATAPGAILATRNGRSATVRLELDPDQQARWPLAPPELSLCLDRDVAAPARVAMEPIDDGVYEAIVDLDERVMLPTAAVDGVALVGPALELPCSPEAEPRYGRIDGIDCLAGLAHASGGAMRHDLLGLYANAQSPGELRTLGPWLVALALLLLVVEIAVRRLRLGFGWLRAAGASEGAAAPGAARPVIRVPTMPVAPKGPAAAAPASEAPATGPLPEAGLHEALRHLRKRKQD